MRRRCRGRAFLLSLLASAFAAAPRVATADEVPPPPGEAPPAPGTPLLELAWSAPNECPVKDRVAAEVADLVGPPHPGQKPLRATGKIARRASREPYVLQLFVGADAAPRTMTGTDCAKLASAAALVLALDIDPGALERVPPSPSDVSTSPEPQPEPEAPPPPVTPRSPRRPPVVRPRPHRPSLEATLGPRFVLDAGSLPRETVAAGAAFGLAWKAIALEVQGTGYERRFTVNGPRNGTGGAYVDLLTVAAHGCARSVASGIEWRGCLGGELGRESTQGISIARPATSSSLWGAVSAAFRARAWPDRIVSPTAGIVVGSPLTSPRVVIDGFHTVFEPPVVFVRAFLGFEAKIF